MTEERLLALVSRIERELEPLIAREALARWQWLGQLDGAAQAAYRHAVARRRAYAAGSDCRPKLEELLTESRDQVCPTVRRQAELLRLELMPHRLPAELGERIAELEVELEAVRVRLPDVRRLGGAGGAGAAAGMDCHPSLPGEALEEALAAAERAAPCVLELIRLRNQGARHLGFVDYYAQALSLHETGEESLWAILTRLAQKSERFSSSPGEGAPAPPDPEIDLDVDGLLALAARYFDAIGLPVARALSRSDIAVPGRRTPGAWCVDVDRSGDVRLVARLHPGAGGARLLLGALGRAVHRLNIAPELPYSLRVPTPGGVEEATALLFERLVYDGRWLAEWTGARLTRKVSKELAARAFVDRMAAVRAGFALAQLERALYKQPGENPAKLAAGMLAKYQPAAAGGPGACWAWVVTACASPLQGPVMLLAEVAASQLASAIEEALDDEALVASPGAGYLLIDKWFLHGARYPWHELTLRAFGQRLQEAAGRWEAVASGGKD